MTPREKEILGSVTAILRDELDPKKIVLFGSRAKGNAPHHADFDIGVETQNCSNRAATRRQIEAVAGLYRIDLVFFDEIDQGFKDIILKTGKVIYEKS